MDLSKQKRRRRRRGRKAAAEPVDSTTSTGCVLQSDANTQVISDSNQSCDVAAPIETPGSQRRIDASVQVEVCAAKLDEQAQRLARLEKENSEYKKEIESLIEHIENIKKCHAFEVKEHRREWEAEKSGMRRRMQVMRDELLSLQKGAGTRVRESTGSTRSSARIDVLTTRTEGFKTGNKARPTK
jgi:predicted RNase H-like nuclease (RuvC/YqgF family)